ncbi:MAG: sporulation protein YjcZ [Bacilli bacterium]|nr:sporulation protein YjcZ [Bacilli bacterium]
MNCCKKNTPEKPCCNNGINTAFIVIVLFILLAIIFAGFGGYGYY